MCVGVRDTHGAWNIRVTLLTHDRIHAWPSIVCASARVQIHGCRASIDRSNAGRHARAHGSPARFSNRRWANVNKNGDAFRPPAISQPVLARPTHEHSHVAGGVRGRLLDRAGGLAAAARGPLRGVLPQAPIKAPIFRNRSCMVRLRLLHGVCDRAVQRATMHAEAFCLCRGSAFLCIV